MRALALLGSLAVAMTRVHVTGRLPLGPGNQTTGISVARAFAYAEFPEEPRCAPPGPAQDVSGHALVARLATRPPCCA